MGNRRENIAFVFLVIGDEQLGVPYRLVGVFHIAEEGFDLHLDVALGDADEIHLIRRVFGGVLVHNEPPDAGCDDGAVDELIGAFKGGRILKDHRGDEPLIPALFLVIPRQFYRRMA